MSKKLRVAFVHDWLDTYRGGEKVLAALIELYPEAPIHTLFYNPTHLPLTIANREIIYPKFLKPLSSFRKLLLPILPSLIQHFDLSEFDLIISSSSSVAKGIRIPPRAKHLCYLHSPMRYAWDQSQHYADSLPNIPGKNLIWDLLGTYLRKWDISSNKQVSTFVVNSNFVRQRVARFYQRDAQVIYPPIDTESINKSFSHMKKRSRSYFLAAGAWVAYKRIDLAIEACEATGQKLIVAGAGPMEPRLRKIAKKYTTFVHAPKNEEFISLIANAKALLFPGVEDFGMLPVEAIGLGTPVIAYALGGALDYVLQGETGVLFADQEVDALAEAITNFKVDSFDLCRLNSFVQPFSKASFQDAIRSEIERL